METASKTLILAYASMMIDSDVITNPDKMSGLSEEKWYTTANDKPLDIENLHIIGSIVTSVSGEGYVPNLKELENIFVPTRIVVDEDERKNTNEVMSYSVNVDGIINMTVYLSFSDTTLKDSGAKVVISAPQTDKVITNTYTVASLKQ